LDLNYKHIVLISVPLILSLFTHLFNPVGFPCLHPDEGKYVRRALYVLDNGSPQDPSSRFDHGQSSTSSYDHPHFAQLLLAGIFKMIGYPSSLNPIPTLQSIEMLYTVPRVLMGLFAVVDTFLLYKIAEFRYDRRVAFIASILFAVMPITWFLRRVYLDSILMPFLLSSILFALYATKWRKDSDNNGSNLQSNKNVINQNRNIVITAILSGILLGISIYTKMPALTLIPLVGFLIYSSNKKFKTLGVWFIPVIAVPLLWPAYAISVGQFGEWMNGVFWQATQREEIGITKAMNLMFLMDPVLIVLSAIGIIYAGIKRDLFILLWVIPFVVFAFLTHWILYFHFILLLPVFCIAAALFITNISKRIMKGRKERYETTLAFSIVSGIGIFGLIRTMIIITTYVSIAQLGPVAYAAAILEHNSLSSRDKDDITTISAPEYSWIFKYAFDNINSVQTRDSSTIKTEKILLMVDRSYLSIVSTGPKAEVEDEKQIERLQNIYNNSNSRVALMNSENTPTDQYPFTNIQDCFTRTAEIRTNY
jgi:Dolichyl-phosphate-mannose-protein mannosyltransferase